MIEVENFTLNADTHAFNVSLASKIGLIEAIILQHFYYWHQWNKNNESTIKDGRVWVFRSVSQIADDYPYLSQDKVRGAIERLEKYKLLIKGNYNTDKFKRACWYSLSDLSLALFGDHGISVLENPEPFGKIPNHLGKSQTINYNNKLPKEYIYNINNTNACTREEEYAEQFKSNKWIESCCMTLHITLEECTKIFNDFLAENKFKEVYHTDFSDFKSHFLNYTKIIISKQPKKKDAPPASQPKPKGITNEDLYSMMYGNNKTE